MGSKLPSFSHLERVTLNGGCPLDSGGLHGRNYGDIECGRATSLPTREVNVSWAAHGSGDERRKFPSRRQGSCLSSGEYVYLFFFAAASLLFVHLKKCFSFLFQYIFVITFYVLGFANTFNSGVSPLH